VRNGVGRFVLTGQIAQPVPSAVVVEPVEVKADLAAQQAWAPLDQSWRPLCNGQKDPSIGFRSLVLPGRLDNG
jgi:hypothetical protein